MDLPAYVEIVFPLNLDQGFTYALPSELRDIVQVGQRVIAPLGKRNQQGMIITTMLQKPDGLKAELREIVNVVDPIPIFDSHLVNLLKWISRYYFTPLGKVVQTAIPSDARLKKEVLVQATADLVANSDLTRLLANRTITKLSALKRRFGGVTALLEVARLQRLGHVELENEFISRRAPIQDWLVRLDLRIEPDPPKNAREQRRLLDLLIDFPDGIALKILTEEYAISRDVVRRLADKDLVILEEIPPDIDPLKDYHRPPPKTVSLNREQQVAFEAITSALDEEKFEPFMLFGVPGSGKTEVYLEATAHALDKGRSAIILVPEIALAPQIAHRFQSRFGEGVALWHSNLKGAERVWTWQQIQKGRIRIVVGARSAILTPIQDLGLIIVDEEQEHSYKQEDSEPRYHARDVALMRGQEESAVVVLGSATPSLESYYNMSTQRYTSLALNDRWEKAQSPLVELVDMNKELEESEDYQNPISRPLKKAIDETLHQGHQIILFQNRRGYSPIVRCRDCGWTMSCPNDEITLTYHKHGNKMRCHYCDHQAAPPSVCPACQSADLQFGGTGTQKIEEALSEQFPEVPVARMDLDTTRGKGAHQKLLGDFARGEKRILLGTQMIAKGLDFERVTLVGVINADAGLHYPDFRARERTFQLVYQVSGRSGRGEFPGKVIIQTWMPEEQSILYATRQDVKKFYAAELDDRNQLNYPPFSRMISLGFVGKDRNTVIQQAENVASNLRSSEQIRLLGPSPALIERSHWGFHWKLILKSDKGQDPTGGKLRKAAARVVDGWNSSRVRLRVDTDPYQLL